MKSVNNQIIEVPTDHADLGIIFTMDPDSDAEREARERYYGERLEEDKRFRQKHGIK